MKKFIGLLACIAFLQNTNAQLTYGAKLGFNLSTQKWGGSGSDDYSTGLLLGLQLGAFGNYRIQEKFAVQAELLYSGEGTTEKSKEFDRKGHIRLNYLRVPVLGQYLVNENLAIETGPSFGIKLSGKEVWEDDQHDMDHVKSFDAGWAIGANYQLSGALPGLSAGARFYLGLTNLISDVSVYGGSSFKNRSFSISFQYALGPK